MDLSLASNSGAIEDQEKPTIINGSSAVPSSSSTTNNVFASVEKEHMFDKVVTPSDVGKLNRLVIPKQQAEKYFPLDSSSYEKGLLLNFEDRIGKQWRFRYSYWNSSQSYVMTKGWSRFVKEKKLDAGDIVSFQRGVGEIGKDRLYIDWRTRAMKFQDPTSLVQLNGILPQSFRCGKFYSFPQSSQPPRNYAVHPYGSNPHYNYPLHHPGLIHQSHGVVGYGFGGTIGGCLINSGEPNPLVIDSAPVVEGSTVHTAAAPGKRLRLFGVNMEYSGDGGTNEEDHHELKCSPSGSIAHSATWASLMHSPSFQPMQINNVVESPGTGCHEVDYDETVQDQWSSKKGKSSLSFNLDQ